MQVQRGGGEGNEWKNTRNREGAGRLDKEGRAKEVRWSAGVEGKLIGEELR